MTIPSSLPLMTRPETFRFLLALSQPLFRGGRPDLHSYDLLLAAEHHAFDHSAIRMNLRTEKSNSPAQKLYAAQGWIQDQRFQGYSKKPARA